MKEVNEVHILANTMIILHTISQQIHFLAKGQVVYNNTDAISDLGNLQCYFLHLGGAWFASRPGQWLVWLTFYGFSQYLQGNAEIVPPLYHDCFVQYVLQLLTNNYTIPYQPCHKLTTQNRERYTVRPGVSHYH
jgi:hypothetical protein